MLLIKGHMCYKSKGVLAHFYFVKVRYSVPDVRRVVKGEDTQLEQQIALKHPSEEGVFAHRSSIFCAPWRVLQWQIPLLLMRFHAEHEIALFNYKVHHINIMTILY